jgi:hypothetical protein
MFKSSAFILLAMQALSLTAVQIETIGIVGPKSVIEGTWPLFKERFGGFASLHDINDSQLVPLGTSYLEDGHLLIPVSDLEIGKEPLQEMRWALNKSMWGAKFKLDSEELISHPEILKPIHPMILMNRFHEAWDLILKLKFPGYKK